MFSLYIAGGIVGIVKNEKPSGPPLILATEIEPLRLGSELRRVEEIIEWLKETKSELDVAYEEGEEAAEKDMKDKFRDLVDDFIKDEKALYTVCPVKDAMQDLRRQIAFL
jgi:hypothetical protein